MPDVVLAAMVSGLSAIICMAVTCYVNIRINTIRLNAQTEVLKDKLKDQTLDLKEHSMEVSFAETSYLRDTLGLTEPEIIDSPPPTV